MSASPRSPRNFLATLFLVVLARVADPFIVRNIEYVIDKRELEKLLDAVLVAVPDWIGPAIDWLGLRGFWGGAFSVLAIWGCFEISHSIARVRRARLVASREQVPPAGERVFLADGVSSADLAKPFHDLTEVDAEALASRHVGKWMRVSGTVRDVAKDQGGNIRVEFETPLFATVERLRLVFTGQDKERAASLPKGAAVTAIGRIRSISYFGVTLDFCEIGKASVLSDASSAPLLR